MVIATAVFRRVGFCVATAIAFVFHRRTREFAGSDFLITFDHTIYVRTEFVEQTDVTTLVIVTLTLRNTSHITHHTTHNST